MADSSGELTVDGVRAPRWNAEPDEVRNLYRRGDPLRAIAREMEGSIDDICRVIADKPGLNEDLERSRSIRRRSLATTKVLATNEDMVDRLFAAGILRGDIPKVLTALDIDVDIEIAVELLHLPGVPGGHLEDALPPQRLGDKLSLLYIAGKHHGIEPDYPLALGKMSLSAVAGLRDLLHPNLPYLRLAEILAVIEATALGIRARTISSLAYSDYDSTAQELSRLLGKIAANPAESWPVPAATLRRRYGHGFWENALNAVGLRLASAEGRLNGDDYLQTLDRFTEECIDFEYPMDLGTYDRWVIADTALRAELPSAVELIRRYGSWKAALETVLPPSKQNETEPAREVHYVDYDSGWGTLEELEKWENQQDNDWRMAEKLIGELITAMPVDSFLHIHYGQFGHGPAIPYARAALGLEGVRCEIVSADGLSPRQWPLSPQYLAANGWSAPYAEVPSWHKAGVTREDAPAQILSGLRLGRHPVEATDLRWTVGRVPDGPGPTEGVTLSATLHGTVQSLGNAAQP